MAIMTRDQCIEVLLRDLQRAAERGSTEQRNRGRLILRGVRAALWAAQSRASVAELEATLREELGLRPVLQQRQPVPAGTTEEVEGND